MKQNATASLEGAMLALQVKDRSFAQVAAALEGCIQKRKTDEVNGLQHKEQLNSANQGDLKPTGMPVLQRLTHIQRVAAHTSSWSILPPMYVGKGSKACREALANNRHSNHTPAEWHRLSHQNFELPL